MKKQYIRDIRAGDGVDDVFALAEKSLAQKKDGNRYLNVTLSDRTGSIKGVLWEDAESVSSGISGGDIVRIQAHASEYKGALQLVVRSIGLCPADSVDPADFIPVTSRNIEAMFERLVGITEKMETACLKDLFGAFWADEDFVRRFKAAPAAKKMHHARIGGLLEHTLSMAILADRVAAHYSGIDRDLLHAGAILHDIGKIREFEYRFRIDYSDEGRLLSHIVIGLQLIDEKIRRIKDFPEEKALLLKHMVVSHHGSQEFGSPEPPKTIEAVLLHYIDEIDSKVNGIREFIASEDPGEAWTSYHRVLERFFYKGRNVALPQGEPSEEG